MLRRTRERRGLLARFCEGLGTAFSGSVYTSKAKSAVAARFKAELELGLGRGLSLRQHWAAAQEVTSLLLLVQRWLVLRQGKSWRA